MASKKPGTTKSKTKAGTTKKANDFRARIRMYRQGIGDSFLLSFPNKGALSHVLIDCGLLLGTPDAKAWMQRVAGDIKESTGGKLDVVVGTHPHWDHLSGFLEADTILNKKSLKVNEVWMAWTENPQDPDGRAIEAKKKSALDVIKTGALQMAASDDSLMREHAEGVAGLLAFQGPDDGLMGVGAAGGRTTAAAVEALRSLGETVKYWNPGDVIELTTQSRIRVYVLGPPRDKAFLGKMLSSREGDMYHLGEYAGLAAAIHSIPTRLTDRDGSIDDGTPFGAEYIYRDANLSSQQSATTLAGDHLKRYQDFVALIEQYKRPSEKWRSIDQTWLLSVEALALQYDNVINNLSMALAFEFVDTGDVMLFPADAQVGNWLSWQSLKWEVEDAKGKKKTITVNDLLARVIFYKVGHHGSHNATLKEGGLENMTHPGLVAAIPVDEVFAKTKKKWDMPASPMYKALQTRTAGRIIRTDGTGPMATKETPDIKGKELDEFKSSVAAEDSAGSLYVDYVIR